MKFQEALDYLYNLQRFGIKLGLQNMHELTRRLPELRRPFSCIHVAGTNGKGSVSAILAEILKHSGFRVGLYTSPHLHCFTERICIDGQPVARKMVADLAQRLRSAAVNIPLTFFEATTALALMAFQRSNTDWVVLETGLGGRLDATNIVSPRLCLITPISLDHQDHLGSSLSQIAKEKAGIIKCGVPVISGVQEPMVAKTLEKCAAAKGSKFAIAGRDYHRQQGKSAFAVAMDGLKVPDLTTVLPGEHQKDNLAQAVAAALHLRNQGISSIDDRAIRKAGQTVRWPARLEWWPGAHKILLDAAHNASGSRSLANYLLSQEGKKSRLVVGLTGNRIPSEVLEPLRWVASKMYFVPVPGVTSVPPFEMASWAQKNKVLHECFDDPLTGFRSGVQERDDEEPLVICGSIYLTATLRGVLQKQYPPSSPQVMGLD